jgi:hypothetical protein
MHPIVVHEPEMHSCSIGQSAVVEHAAPSQPPNGPHFWPAGHAPASSHERLGATGSAQTPPMHLF